jgi:hypothetical protein
MFNITFAELLCRIRAEYLEMPGLRLTPPQARCLFGLDAKTWDAVLAALVDSKFLSQTRNGLVAIAGNTGVARGRTSGIGVDSNVTSTLLQPVDGAGTADPRVGGLIDGSGVRQDPCATQSRE